MDQRKQGKFVSTLLSLGLLLTLLPTSSHPAPWRTKAYFQSADALSFGGTNAYVTFGPASKLNLSAFTLETWFRRDGVGQTAYTGKGGVDAIPLITKGRAEADGGRVDMNYFLGIDGARGVLVADLEDKKKGANYPVWGVTALRLNTWYHAAATYDGNKWRLYLNGVLEAEVNVGKAVRNDSLQHAALATALDSKGTPKGFFDGALDEVRIWSYALPAQQIIDGMRKQLTASVAPTASGLVARWGLNDGSGTEVFNSVSQSPAGTLQGTNWSWSEGVAFANNRAPATPLLLGPSQGANSVATTANMSVAVADPDNDNLIVSWYGKAVGTHGPDFTLVVLPDTQFYAAALRGGTPDMFTAQTQWIVNNKTARNIAYVAHLGDCVNQGNNATEWSNGDFALRLLEDPVTTGWVDGIPFGLAVGNNDQSPKNTPDGNTTKLYNQYFGTTRFRARNYYGGRFTNNHDNHFQLFSASGLDFIVIYLEYDQTPDDAILQWADNLLKTYSHRRAIVVSHYLMDEEAIFSPQGQAAYDTLKDNPNLFLMLGGHLTGERHRQDVFAGRTVHTLLSNYQNLANGGNGWLRLLEFSPAHNQIRVKTFSPVLNQFETDSDSQFSFSYDQQGSGFSPLQTQPNAATGTVATTQWTGLRPNTEYEWYVTVSDGLSATTSPRWRFRTGVN
jgi:hypothetical protein